MRHFLFSHFGKIGNCNCNPNCNCSCVINFGIDLDQKNFQCSIFKFGLTQKMAIAIAMISGVVVGPSFLGFGLALPLPVFLWWWGWPFLLSLSGGWPFLEWGLALGPAFSECGHWPFCLRVGRFALPSSGQGWPSLLGPVRLSHGGGCLLLWGVRPLFLEWDWPFFLGGCTTCPPEWGLALPSLGVVVGLSFSGLGFGPCRSFFGGGLPFLLGLSVRQSFWECGLALPSWDPVFGPSLSCWGFEEAPKKPPKKHPKSPEHNAMKSLEKASK